MAEPFQNKKLEPGNFLQRLLKLNPKRNSFIEANNLMASANDVENVNQNQFLEISKKYKIIFKKRFISKLQPFYKDYLIHCLSDFSLSDSDLSGLKHLQEVFNLSEKKTVLLRDSTVQETYGDEFRKLISNGRLSVDDKKFSDKIEKSLKLPAERASEIRENISKDHVSRFVEKIIENQRFSPDEETELREMSKSLGVKIDPDEKTKTLLAKYRYLWMAESGDLPEVSSGINLQRGEKCYLKTQVGWNENRTVSQTISKHRGQAYILHFVNHRPLV